MSGFQNHQFPSYGEEGEFPWAVPRGVTDRQPVTRHCPRDKSHLSGTLFSKLRNFKLNPVKFQFV